MQALTKMTVDRPELVKILNKDESDWTPEMAYDYHILYTFAHVFHIRQKKSIKRQRMDWMVRMDENFFEERKIIEYWKSDLELEKWFDPAFEDLSIRN
jgi:hypothetical protein